MELLVVIISLVKSVQFGLEYNENLRISEKGNSLIQEVTSKNKIFGVKITRGGVTPTKAFDIDAFTGPFELYELSLESANKLYGRILSSTSDGKYALKGLRKKITPTIVNALFLKNLKLLCGCESLVVTKRDYLSDGIDILNAFRLAGLNVKYVVPESLAYLAFLAHDRKIDSKNAVVINLKGKKTVFSLNEVLAESKGNDEKNGARSFKIRRAKTEIYEELSDDHIKKIILEHLKEKIQECVSNQDIPVQSADLPVSFVPGPLESNMYCNIDGVYGEVLSKWKSGGSLYKPDHVDLYRIEGHKIDLEDVEISLKEIEHKVRMFIKSVASEFKTRLGSITTDLHDFQTIVISEFMFGDFDTTLLDGESLRTNNSDIGIAKGALYLNFAGFTLECADVVSAQSDKSGLYTSQNDIDELMEEIVVYRRLEEILEKIGDREIKDVLELCPSNAIMNLQHILNAKDWCYENAKMFVDEYSKHESKNKRLKEDAEFRTQYIENLNAMLNTARELETSKKELWNLVQREYEEIREWFDKNKAREDVEPSEFKNRYLQLEDSIGFFREKLTKQKAEARRKMEEDAERLRREKEAEDKKHKDEDNKDAPNGATELPKDESLNDEAKGENNISMEHGTETHLQDESAPAGETYEREEL